MFTFGWVCAFDRRLKKVGDYDQYDQWGLVLQDFIKYIRQKEPYTNGGWKLKIPHRSSIQMFQAATHICQFTIEIFRISVIFWVVVGRITISKSKLKHSQEEISWKLYCQHKKTDTHYTLHVFDLSLERVEKQHAPPQKKKHHHPQHPERPQFPTYLTPLSQAQHHWAPSSL